MFMSGIVAHRLTPRAPRPCPGDFDETFVRIGRLACEEHYCAGRRTITRWLEERGKRRLINARTEHVLSLLKTRLRRCPPDFELAYVRLGTKQCRKRYQATYSTISRWLDECGRDRLLALRQREIAVRAAEIGRIVSRAYPVNLTAKPR
jgi:hypothetical protein